jgi:hypothetical protein
MERQPMAVRPAVRRTPRCGNTWSPLLALAILLPGSAVSAQTDPPIYPHPSAGGAFPLPQAYYPTEPADAGAAVGGTLVMQTLPNSDALDANAFATFNAAIENSPVVVSYRLVVQVARSTNYPSVFPGKTVTQMGNSVQTVWSTMNDSPGSTFILEVRVRCTLNGSRSTREHIDQWTWRVVATTQTLRALIDALFSHPDGNQPSQTLIPSQQTRLALLAAVQQIDSASGSTAKRQKIAAMETLVKTAAANGKIVATKEHPGPYLILVDLEAIAAQLP